jgi:hypothetical protein
MNNEQKKARSTGPGPLPNPIITTQLVFPYKDQGSLA